MGVLGGLFRLSKMIIIVKYDDEKEDVVRGPDGFCVLCKPGEPGEMLGALNDADPFRRFGGCAGYPLCIRPRTAACHAAVHSGVDLLCSVATSMLYAFPPLVSVLFVEKCDVHGAWCTAHCSEVLPVIITAVVASPPVRCAGTMATSKLPRAKCYVMC